MSRKRRNDHVPVEDTEDEEPDVDDAGEDFFADVHARCARQRPIERMTAEEEVAAIDRAHGGDL